MLRRFINSFRFARQGLAYVFKEEENFFMQVMVGGATLAAGFWLDFSPTELALLVVVIGLVLGAEILNTILEDIANELQPQHDPLVGKVKDMMAGFVLITALAALGVGVLLFGPRLLSYGIF